MIAIINYGMGNLASVKKSLRKLGYDNIITNQEKAIRDAKVLILPGVGSFQAAMENLNTLGFTNLLREEVIGNQKPILGICLGMQLFASIGYEDGITKGLDLIKGEVIKIKVDTLPIPHIGWNDIKVRETSLFTDIKDFNFYFVHSYFFNVSNENDCIGIVEYGHPMTAVVRQGNIVGTQFHPEKSQEPGLTFLKNFLCQYA